MAFTLQEVVPWGRSFDEYRAMFDLHSVEVSARILGCGDGPAGFNGEMHRRGRFVVSVDPLYRFTADQIRARIHETCSDIVMQLHRNRERFIWDRFATPEAVGRERMAAMDCFLEHFEMGKKAGRYMACGLPSLPFVDAAFDLALCSHFLFLYDDRFSTAFHLQAIEAMARVAREVRIFPLFTLAGEVYPSLKTVCEWIEASGRRYDFKTVDYEFQRGSNQMLRIWNV